MQHQPAAHPQPVTPKPSLQPATAPAPAHHLDLKSQPTAAQAVQAPTAQTSATQPAPEDIPTPRPNDLDEPGDQPEAKHKEKHRSANGHAGLVGFLVFLVVGGLLMSPLLPGVVLDNFPGSSQSFSTGDQTIACLHTPTKVKTTEAFTTKLGAPVAYYSATETTMTGLCDGKSQTATGGHSSQLNPLGALINLVAALVAAIIVGKIWGAFFRRR